MKLFPSVRFALTLTASLAACAVSQSAYAEALRLNFGVYSSNKPSAMVRVFKPVLNELESRMSEKLGREVDIRMQIAKDYDQGISHLTDGKVDFSRFGPASYIEAKKMNEDIRILAMESKKGEKVFYGIIATKADSEIETVEDLRNQSFAFGDEGSTIGRFLSQLYLEQNSIRSSDLNKYEYLGRHDRVGTAVGAGDFDAGALNESTFKKLVKAGEPLRELAKFPNVTKPWIARSGLDATIFEALQLSLLEIKQKEALKGLKIEGFLNGGDADYAVIREAMDFNYKFFESPSMSPQTGNSSASVSPESADVVDNTEATLAITDAPVVKTDEMKVKSDDVKSVEAASAILAEQVAPTGEPSIAAALPTATTGNLSASEQENAGRAAHALATVTATQPRAIAATSNLTVAPSNYVHGANNLTINIALPKQLVNQNDAQGSSQNITINLSFPEDNR